MKHFLPGLFVLLLPVIGAAQALPISWEHSYGGSDYDDVKCICPAGDGSYVFAGSTYSTNGDITGTMHGVADCLIMKVNPSGGIVWERTIGGPELERANSIQQTTDNGFILGGFTNSNSIDVSGNHGSGDAWFVKLDDTGAILWQKCYGGSGFDNFFGVIQSNDGGYLAVGHTSSPDGDVIGYAGTGLPYVWVVKLDDTGGIQWQQTLGGSGGAVGRTVLQTSDSGYIIAGYTGSSDGDVTGNHGGVDSWIIKLSVSGSVVWKKCYGGTYIDAALSICPAIGGGFVFAGQTASTDGDVSHFYGGDINGGDVWVVRINDTGTILWERSYGGSGNEMANSIHPTAGNNYVIAGWTESRDGDVSGRKDTTDAWVLLINNTGAIQWQKCLGGTNRDHAFDVIQTADTGFLVACVTASSNGDVSVNYGLNDCWLVKLSNTPPTGVPLANDDHNILLLPNPSAGHFLIQGSTTSAAIDISITDLAGKQVYYHHYNAPPGQFSVPININGPAGIYYAHVVVGDKLWIVPFVLQE